MINVGTQGCGLAAAMVPEADIPGPISGHMSGKRVSANMSTSNNIVFSNPMLEEVTNAQISIDPKEWEVLTEQIQSDPMPPSGLANHRSSGMMKKQPESSGKSYGEPASKLRTVNHVMSHGQAQGSPLKKPSGSKADKSLGAYEHGLVSDKSKGNSCMPDSNLKYSFTSSTQLTGTQELPRLSDSSVIEILDSEDPPNEEANAPADPDTDGDEDCCLPELSKRKHRSKEVT